MDEGVGGCGCVSGSKCARFVRRDLCDRMVRAVRESNCARRAREVCMLIGMRVGDETLPEWAKRMLL